MRSRGLVGHVDPVQLAIRLLVPRGSSLYGTPSLAPHVGDVRRRDVLLRLAPPRSAHGRAPAARWRRRSKRRPGPARPPSRRSRRSSGWRWRRPARPARAGRRCLTISARAPDGGVRAAPDRDVVLLSGADDGPVWSDTEYRAGGVMPMTDEQADPRAPAGVRRPGGAAPHPAADGGEDVPREGVHDGRPPARRGRGGRLGRARPALAADQRLADRPRSGAAGPFGGEDRADRRGAPVRRHRERRRLDDGRGGAGGDATRAGLQLGRRGQDHPRQVPRRGGRSSGPGCSCPSFRRITVDADPDRRGAPRAVPVRPEAGRAVGQPGRDPGERSGRVRGRVRADRGDAGRRRQRPAAPCGRVVHPGPGGGARRAARSGHAPRAGAVRQAGPAGRAVLRGDDLRHALAALRRGPAADRRDGRAGVGGVRAAPRPDPRRAAAEPRRAGHPGGRGALDRRPLLERAAVRRGHVAGGADPAARRRAGDPDLRAGAGRRPAR